MTHHTDAELLPCPFCGCEAHFEMDDDRWEWIECGSCGMQGNRSASLMEDCKPKLAEAWNRRAPAAPVPQGWKLVPVESTEAMARAFRADDAPGYFCMTTLRCADFSERYAAMLAAAHQRIYIAGPMTGLPDNNHAAFNDAAERLRNRGWHVENPAENPPPHVDASCAWNAYMRMGVSQLMTCHAIYLLPGWQQSKGASLEYLIAQRLGLQVHEHARQEDVLQEQLQQLVAAQPALPRREKLDEECVIAC